MVYTIYTIYYILLLFKNWQKEGTIAQWISLCLPICGYGVRFPSKTSVLFQFILELWWEKDENKEKEVGICKFKK